MAVLLALLAQQPIAALHLSTTTPKSSTPDHTLSPATLSSRRSLLLRPTGCLAALAAFRLRCALASNLPADNGAAGAGRGELRALVPIARAARALSRASSYVLPATGDSRAAIGSPELRAASAALEGVPAEERAFKRLFDEYSVGVSYKQQYMDKNAFLVYYSRGFDGPGRGSIEAESEQEALQKAQFGARNEAWIAVDDFRSEVTFLLSNGIKEDEDLSELREAARRANAAFAAYLDLAPAADVAAAMKIAETSDAS